MVSDNLLKNALPVMAITTATTKTKTMDSDHGALGEMYFCLPYSSSRFRSVRNSRVSARTTSSPVW